MPCEFCDKEHGKICPSVKAIEYHANGKVKRVEFMTPRDYHPILLGTTAMPTRPALGPPPAPSPVVPYWDPFPNRIVCGLSQGTVDMSILVQNHGFGSENVQ